MELFLIKITGGLNQYIVVVVVVVADNQKGIQRENYHNIDEKENSLCEIIEDE